MSLYKAYIAADGYGGLTKVKWIKEYRGQYSNYAYTKVAYGCNLTNARRKQHRYTPILEDGYLVVSPYEEVWDSQNGFYGYYGQVNRKWYVCEVMR